MLGWMVLQTPVLCFHSVHAGLEYTVENLSRVAFTPKEILILEIYVGSDTIEISWPSARSDVSQSISITNTNFVKMIDSL